MIDPFHAARYPLSVEKAGGRVAREGDYDAYIGQLIRQVLLTAPGERVHRPDFGAGLGHLVFSPNSPATASLVQTVVHEALQTWLGTFVILEDVQVAAADERLSITVMYTVRSRGDRHELTMDVTH
ncbi:GPW/gp25 family protein [Bradyrhizobium japonicum]|uniref:GPW/gp25 family protein n=1 Tax=Bradyrhizobium japonicum TaxID=375 RepID=UPI000400E834|nr:GPW/gp25 family protein [Bradyrhizobium japonicum]WLB91317.1 GPW/gp25 family protein [Bradyrhizobium japonicum USDA 135]